MQLLDAAAGRAADKAMRHLLPWLLLMYMLAFLDRANLGFAKNAFQASTGISEAAYAFGVGIFSVAYSSIEVPSNILMHRFGARRWLSRIMVTWGLVSASMAFVHTAFAFYCVRILLGIAEAGFFPGAVYFLSRWFPDARRAGVMGIFYFGAPLSFVFGGPLSGLLLEADGLAGLHGWQWLFLVEGLLASLVGVLVFFKLTEAPENAGWLEPEERKALAAAIAAEDREKQARHGVSSVLQGLVNGRILYLAAIYFLIQAAVYGVTYYLPPQVGRLLGRNVGLIVGLVTAVPWACALAAAYFLPRLAERLGRRRQVAALTMFGCAVGMALSVLLAGTPLLALAALCLVVAGFIAVQPLFWTMPTAYLGGAAAASGLALVNTLGALAGFVSPQFRLWAETTFGSGGGLYAISLTTALGAAMILAAGRIMTGKG